MSDIVVVAVVLGTIAAVLIRPRGISEGFWALAGGALVLLFGGLSWRAAVETLGDISGVFIFLWGLFWLALVASRAGLVERAAWLAVRASGGDGHRLLAAIFVLGTLTTALLSNDATVVLVTPVVIYLCRTLRIPALPYVFATTFVADTASSLLPVSNPVNLLYAERFDIAFVDHVGYLALPTLVGVGVNAIMVDVVFRQQIPRSIPLDRPASPLPGLARADRLVAAGLAAVGLGYVVAAISGLAPYLVTIAGGIALATVSLAGKRVTVGDLARAQPPSLYAFVAGLGLVVAASESAGLLDGIGNLVGHLTEAGDVWGILGITVGTALGTNLINNWTMALAVLPALEQAEAGNGMIFGSMLGADIGPNLSVVGSLATLIWLTEIRREGLAVSGWTYLRLGVICTIPALLAASLTLVAIVALV